MQGRITTRFNTILVHGFVVWTNFFLMNVFSALKGSKLFIINRTDFMREEAFFTISMRPFSMLLPNLNDIQKALNNVLVKLQYNDQEIFTIYTKSNIEDIIRSEESVQ